VSGERLEFAGGDRGNVTSMRRVRLAGAFCARGAGEGDFGRLDEWRLIDLRHDGTA
jgi:hypothetical protein